MTISLLGFLPFQYLDNDGEEDGKDQEQPRTVDADDVHGLYLVGTLLHYYLNLCLFNHFSFF